MYNNLHLFYDLTHFRQLGQNYKNISVSFWPKLIKLKTKNKILAHHFRAPGEVVMRQHDSSLGPVGTRGV